jgi:hypothetical protein
MSTTIHQGRLEDYIPPNTLMELKPWKPERVGR